MCEERMLYLKRFNPACSRSKTLGQTAPQID